MSFYRALVEMDLGGPVNPGDILTAEHLAGRDVNVLTRLKYAEFVKDETSAPPPTPKAIETVTDQIETEEVVAPVEEEKSDEPVRASVSKHGVWFKVFAGSMQVGKPTRDEKQAKRIAKEFNASL